ncbi:MAG: TolC family protein, partial [Gammaproteobacteria bacterium]
MIEKIGRYLLLGLLVAGAAVAEGASSDTTSDPLPEPLTLEAALRLARPQVPLLLKAEAQQQSARAGLLESEALDGLRVKLDGSLWAIKPSYRSSNRSSNDSSAHLRVHKRLYDFGYQPARKDAAARRVAAGKAEQLDARQRNRLAIMQAYFDVILADLEFARDNEAMSVAFVQYDRARDRHELGQVSDVDLLRLQAAYEVVHRRQVASAARQRLARSRLALAMGRPGELVSELEMPEITIP